MTALTRDWRRYLTAEEFEEEAQLGRDAATLARQIDKLNDRLSTLRAARRGLEFKGRSRARYAAKKARAAAPDQQRSA